MDHARKKENETTRKQKHDTEVTIVFEQHRDIPISTRWTDGEQIRLEHSGEGRCDLTLPTPISPLGTSIGPSSEGPPAVICWLAVLLFSSLRRLLRRRNFINMRGVGVGIGLDDSGYCLWFFYGCMWTHPRSSIVKASSSLSVALRKLTRTNAGRVQMICWITRPHRL